MAQYSTDFGEYTAGSLPADWSVRFTSAPWSVVADVSSISGKALRLVAPATLAVYGVSWSNIDADVDRANSEILIRFRAVGIETALILSTFARGAGGETTGTYFGASINANQTPDALRAVKRVSGTFTTISAVNSPSQIAPGAAYWMRTRVNGSSVSVRIWADGSAEPATWQVGTTDTAISAAGWVGFAYGAVSGPGNAGANVDWFSVGTNGDSAQSYSAPADTAAPELTSPSATATGATTASGSVTTDEANGTLYYLASANASESVATVKAGSSQAVTAIGAQPVTVTGLTASTPYYLHFVHADAAANDSAVATSPQFTTDAETVVVKGVTIPLYNGSTLQANLTDLRALWWDAAAPDGTAPDYYSATESTDAAGLLSIDLDAVTALSVGDYGYLHVHKAGTLANQYRDAAVFSGAVQVQDIG